MRGRERYELRNRDTPASNNENSSLSKLLSLKEKDKDKKIILDFRRNNIPSSLSSIIRCEATSTENYVHPSDRMFVHDAPPEKTVVFGNP